MATNNAINEGTAASGKVLQGQGVGTTSAFSTATYPAVATTTGQLLRADGTNWTGTTATFPNTAGTSGNVLTSDGTNWSSSAASSPLPSAIAELYDEFTGGVMGTTIMNSQLNWNTVVQMQQASFASTRCGVIKFPAATSVATSGTMLQCTGLVPASYPILLGGGVITVTWIFKLFTLSGATNRYIFRCGLGDTQSADMANGCYMEYSDNINSGNYVLKTASSSVRTTVNTAVAVDAANWHNITLTINAGGTSVSWTLDGSALGSAIITNLPTSNVTLMAQSLWVAGTIPQPNLDMVYFKEVFTTPR